MVRICCFSGMVVSPRLNERPPKDVSPPIEASLDLDIFEGGGEMLGVAFMPNPNCSWSNGLGLEAGAEKELDAMDGLQMHCLWWNQTFK